MTPMQHKILWHIHKEGEEFATCIGDGARRQGFGVTKAAAGGLIFRAYQNPLYFMEGLGWTERVDRNAAGIWHRLTPKGREVAASLPRPYRH